MKAEQLDKQINYIDFEPLKKFVYDYFNNAVPDYFFVIPASSSGKYHPEQDLGSGGLIRHTQMAVEVAIELLNLEMWARLLPQKDSIIAALLIHDTIKNGFEDKQYTQHEHPIFASQHFRKYAEKVGTFDFMQEEIVTICSCVETHMGQWNTSKFSKTNLRKPETPLQKFVHLCDYIASRKFIGDLSKY